MCLGVPAQIVAVEDRGLGRVAVAGVSRMVSLELISNPQVGEWVILHAGYAIQRIEAEAAAETLKLCEYLGNDELKSENGRLKGAP